jgi:hypothetical protein
VAAAVRQSPALAWNELLETAEEAKARLMQKLDANKDGKLNMSEISTGVFQQMQ